MWYAWCALRGEQQTRLGGAESVKVSVKEKSVKERVSPVPRGWRDHTFLGNGACQWASTKTLGY